MVLQMMFEKGIWYQFLCSIGVQSIAVGRNNLFLYNNNLILGFQCGVSMYPMAKYLFVTLYCNLIQYPLREKEMYFFM